LHSDPKFPDCAPGQTKQLRGWLSFYEGTDIEAEMHRIQTLGWDLGHAVSPDDAWLGSRGLRTMALRLKQHGESALTVAKWLKERPEVGLVLHPALPDCPGHEYWRRDFKGSSGLFSFALNDGTEAARAALIDGLEHFGIGYSWGGFESLALPVDPARYRTATNRHDVGLLVRLQIGIEDPDDLIADLAAGLARFRGALA